MPLLYGCCYRCVGVYYMYRTFTFSDAVMGDGVHPHAVTRGGSHSLLYVLSGYGKKIMAIAPHNPSGRTVLNVSNVQVLREAETRTSDIAIHVAGWCIPPSSDAIRTRVCGMLSDKMGNTYPSAYMNSYQYSTAHRRLELGCSIEEVCSLCTLYTMGIHFPPFSDAVTKARISSTW